MMVSRKQPYSAYTNCETSCQGAVTLQATATVSGQLQFSVYTNFYLYGTNLKSIICVNRMAGRIEGGYVTCTYPESY